MFGRVSVCLDGMAPARGVFAFAREWAERLRRPLRLYDLSGGLAGTAAAQQANGRDGPPDAPETPPAPDLGRGDLCVFGQSLPKNLALPPAPLPAGRDSAAGLSGRVARSFACPGVARRRRRRVVPSHRRPALHLPAESGGRPDRGRLRPGRGRARPARPGNSRQCGTGLRFRRTDRPGHQFRRPARRLLAPLSGSTAAAAARPLVVALARRHPRTTDRAPQPPGFPGAPERRFLLRGVREERTDS